MFFLSTPSNFLVQRFQNLDSNNLGLKGLSMKHDHSFCSKRIRSKPKSPILRKTQEGIGSVCSGSGLFESLSVRCGSVKRFSRFDAFGLRFSDASWLGPVGSVRFRVRFRPVPELNCSVRFGSVKHFSRFDAFGLRFSDASWLGPVGSVRFRVQFRPVPELNCSVRFGSAGSVRFLIPS